MGASQNYNVSLNINANTQSAEKQLQKLQSQLHQISNMDLKFDGSKIADEIREASEAALELQSHLKVATNASTGKLDFTKLNASLKQSGISLDEYGRKLINLGPQGQKAFMDLSTAISKSEIPLKRTSKVLNSVFDNLKKTIGWQLSSSAIHGTIGAIQQATGYAKDLNRSLTDIRIVTGQSTEQMAQFARQANQAAKRLSTTTTDYTKASLIYYQQGLSDAEVKARTETTIKMANATGTTAQTVSDQMTAIWNNYANGSKSLEHYADVMTALGAATASSTDEIAQGLQKFAAISNTVGLSYEYAASALATITAESRESADVVGNALKTLFSRIQGLQLGKTLDDGTTLNKYSSALAKVGISIKDQSGGLKDMDIILDEMGSKWSTLARDEKMALAQTVAGVRQYTQLMTLMENWDDFKTNLNTAQNSTGTLDNQASIYADSWEAASKRVRAAFEGLWDNLIDSEGTVEVLDFFANIVEGIDNMVTSIGGAKGALMGFGGLFAKIFNESLKTNINDVAQGIYKLTPHYAKSQAQAKAERLQELQNAIDDEVGAGSEQSKVMKRIMQSRLQEDEERAKKEKGLNAAQKEKLASKEAKLEAVREKEIEAAAKADAAKERRASIAIDSENVDLNDDYKSGGKAATAELWAKDLENAQAKTQDIRDRLEIAEGKYKTSKESGHTSKALEMGAEVSRLQSELLSAETTEKNIQRKIEKQRKEINTADAEKYSGKTTRREALQGVAATNNEFLQTVQSITEKGLNDNTVKDIVKAAGEKGYLEGDIKNFEKNIKSAIQDLDDSAQVLERINKEVQKMAELRQKDLIDDMDLPNASPTTEEEDRQVREGYREYTDTFNQEFEANREGKSAKEKGEGYSEDIKGILNSPEGKITTWTDALVDGAQGLMSAAAAGESLKALSTSIQDGTITFSSALTSITSVAMQSSIGIAGLSKAIGQISNVSAATAGWIGIAITAALALASTILDIADRMTVSDKELEQNLAMSDNELNSSAETAKQTIEQYKTQNESYLSTVEKIKSLSYDPFNMAEDIFQANKQALELIEQYGLSSNEYKTNANGLIEIDKAILDSKVKQQETTAKEAEYAQILGKAINNIDKASLNYDEVAKQTKNSIDKIINQGAYVYGNVAMSSPNAEGAVEKQRMSAVQAFSYDKLWEVWDAKESGDKTAQEQWNTWMQEFARVDWKAIESSFKQQKEAGIDADYASGVGALNSARVLTNKLLTDQGINADNKDAYGAYAENIAKQVVTDMSNGEYQLLDPSKNQQLTTEQQELIRGYLKEYKGVEGAGQFKVENGQIMYKGEGDTEYQHVMASTVNGWYAQEEMAKKMAQYQQKANAEWEGILADLGEGNDKAAEAAFQVKEFGTVAGANAESAFALYNMQKQGKLDEDSPYRIGAEQNKILDGIFGENGFANALGMGEGGAKQSALSHTSLGALENLYNSIPQSEEGIAAFTNLFGAIQTAIGVQNEDGEGLSEILTLLSNLDFTDDSFLNLKNIKNQLQELGYSVDEGNLPIILEYLREILGLSPPSNEPDDPGSTNDKYTSNKNIMNKIQPKGTYDEATKQAAMDAGLDDPKYWAPDGGGGWIFTGTQEDIDNARRETNRNYGIQQKDIDTKQTTHETYTGAGAAQTYTDKNAFLNDLNSTEEGTSGKIIGTRDITTKKFDEKGLNQLLAYGVTGYDLNTGLYTTVDEEEITAEQLATNLGAGKYYNAVTGEEYGADYWRNKLTELDNKYTYEEVTGQENVYEPKSTDKAVALGDFLLNNFGVKKEGDKWVKPDENGGFIEVTYKDWEDYTNAYNNEGYGGTEQRDQDVAKYVNESASASEIMNAVNDKVRGFVDNDKGIMSDAAIARANAFADSSERTREAWDKLYEAKQNYNEDASKENEAAVLEAQRQFDLAQAVDAVAAARGLDAEQVAIQAEAIQSNFTGQINGIEVQGKLTAEAIADMAAEMISASNAATKLKSKSKDLYKNINSKDAAAASSALVELEKDVIALIGAEGDAVKAGPSFRKYLKENQDVVEAAANGNEKALNKLRQAYVDSSIAEGGLLDDVALAAKNLGKTEDFNNIKSNIAGLGEAISSLQADGLWNVGEALTRGLGGVGDTLYNTIDGLMALGPAGQAAAQAIGDAFGFNVTHVDVSAKSLSEQNYKGVVGVEGVGGAIDYKQGNEAQALIEQGGTVKIPVITPKAGGGSGKAGGGGGGGGKEPKKVAQTRRSQVVKRYKNVDAQRAANKNRRDNMSKKTDKLYGESRITNLQKENKLLEEGLRLNEKKAEEALKNLKIDEESLRKMTKKYGYELELDSEGNIKNYEDILGDIYDQLHKLELDGELSEEEEKIKEELEIRKQEIEGAMEDWEDTLKQLEELNNEYEELIDEMHSNELEQITYKLEFELELNELDTEWYDFLNEQIGDDFTQAVDTMDLITEKIKIANDDINLYKQSVTDLMENIENDPNRSLVTGYLVDGVLTDEEAEILKEAYSGIIEQLSILAEAKTAAEELLVSIFEGYKERIDLDTTALEHYTSLLEHFGNVVDIVGQKQLGLSDRFMENMAKMRIQQSKDVMSAAQSELAAYEQIRAKAEEELARAREEGRTNDIDYWQQQLNDANTSIQEARDKLVTSFEDILNAIADAFDRSIERIVQTFNDAIYAFGGLEGLSQDYSFIRENTELMAQDYEKIYELSKLNRNINKTLNDNNIIAGKQKMIELQKEINDLQASGAELSKYDLEYLQAKYELRLAEIELENAQNAKETVRLSKDSEGNWSYVYTASTEKIDEAQQKYEDALYKMQNLSYEYIDEMSEKIISTSQAMMEEIQNLNKNNFENEQEYLAEINRIKAKYAESLGITEEELNKALANNEELYDKDWQSYSNKTGYAISESQNWIDRYAESTLGTLMKSTSDVANYMDNFSLALDELTNSLYRIASDYYNGIDDAFAAAGITKEEFASFVTTNTKAIMDASTNTKKDIETQTSTLVKEYRIQADKVTEIQRILDAAIDEYGPYIKEIRDILRESAALTKEQQNKDATYTYKQAADLFNSKYGDDYKIETDDKGRWKKTVEGVKNEILQKHAKAKTDEEKKYYADMYTWLTSYILPYVTSLDTGGYTGEWGTSGRLAMLHEKELILNANDTANFLDALNVSRELVNKVIEMNARASSFGIGGLSPSSIQDFAQNLEQQVTITAEFPNAVDHNEIEEAFASLINTASQYANRK